MVPAKGARKEANDNSWAATENKQRALIAPNGNMAGVNSPERKYSGLRPQQCGRVHAMDTSGPGDVPPRAKEDLRRLRH